MKGLLSIVSMYPEGGGVACEGGGLLAIVDNRLAGSFIG